MNPRPGDFGVVSTLHASTLLDGAVARAIQFDTESPVNHAFICVRENVIIEAMPGGARTNSVVSYPNALWASPGISDCRRQDISERAEKLLGTPYNWLDLLAIGLAQKRWSPTLRQQWDSGDHVPWWVQRVGDPRRLICSQLVDLAMQAGNVHLFDDGRLPGLVSPGDLYYWILRHQPPSSRNSPQ